MRSNFSRPLGKWLAPIAGVIVIVASTTVAQAGSLTAGAVVRVPDNPLGGNATCAALVAQQTALGSRNFPASEVEPVQAATCSSPLARATSIPRWIEAIQAEQE